MEKIKVFIIEDEIPAQKLLEKWIAEIPQLTLGGIYGDGFSALKAIQSEKPDLIFLDIEMPKLSGLEMLELIEDPPKIIFTTAYQEYAIHAFELEALDYLLKPYSFERFKQAVDKSLSLSVNSLDRSGNTLPTVKKAFSNLEHNQRIVVKEGVDIFIITTDEVYFIEAQDDYICIHTKDKKYLKLASLQSFEDTLAKNDFVRVHRSYLLNINFISRIEQLGKETYRAILNNKEELKISRSGLLLLKQKLSI
ncbi:MAG: LytTR family DNA-binding domain-containing protein [Bacteroidota bacterium]